MWECLCHYLLITGMCVPSTIIHGFEDIEINSWCCNTAKSLPLYVNVTDYHPSCLIVFALLCFVVVIHWLIFPYPSGLLHWHCGNLTIAPVPAKQPWWIWINTSCKFIMNDCITTTKQSTTKPCAYFLGYTVCPHGKIYSRYKSSEYTYVFIHQIPFEIGLPHS